MRTAHAPEHLVVVAESTSAPSLVARLAQPGRPVACYASVEDLVRVQPLKSVAVLVLQSSRSPRGAVLATLGRLSHEYPGMQQLVVLEEPPPLVVAGFLTSCGVDLVWTGLREETLDRVASAVVRMCEQASWSLA